MLKQVFLARFEPVLTEFSPFHRMYSPLCAFRTYLRAVWWSHLELGEGCRLEDIYIYIYIRTSTTNQGENKKGEREDGTPQFYVYRAGLWWGKVHLCPPHKGRKNSYFNNLPTTP